MFIHMDAYCPKGSTLLDSICYNGYIYRYTNLDEVIMEASEAYDDYGTYYFVNETSGKRIYIYDKNSWYILNYSFLNEPILGFKNDPNQYLFWGIHDNFYVRDDFKLPTLIDNNGIDNIFIQPAEDYRLPADNAFIITNQELISKIVNTALSDRDFSPYITSVDDYTPEVIYSVYIRYIDYPLLHQIY